MQSNRNRKPCSVCGRWILPRTREPWYLAPHAATAGSGLLCSGLYARGEVCPECSEPLRNQHNPNCSKRRPHPYEVLPEDCEPDRPRNPMCEPYEVWRQRCGQEDYRVSPEIATKLPNRFSWSRISEAPCGPEHWALPRILDRADMLKAECPGPDCKKVHAHDGPLSKLGRETLRLAFHAYWDEVLPWKVQPSGLQRAALETILDRFS